MSFRYVPAARQRLEQGDLIGSDQGFGVGQLGLGADQGPFGVEHRQEAVGARVEPQAGQADSLRRLVPRLAQGVPAVQFVGVVRQRRLGLLQGDEHGLVEGRQGGAGSDAALATFDQTVLVALQETETALANYANELDRRNALQSARDQAATAARLSRLRFDAGADSFFTVLDAERTLAAADAQLAASDALVTTYQIALFKALAGGWSEG